MLASSNYRSPSPTVRRGSALYRICAVATGRALSPAISARKCSSKPLGGNRARVAARCCGGRALGARASESRRRSLRKTRRRILCVCVCGPIVSPSLFFSLSPVDVTTGFAQNVRCQL